MLKNIGAHSIVARANSSKGVFRYYQLGLFAVVALGSTACNKPEKKEPETIELKLAASHEGAAFMAVHGSSAEDVWAVGADDGTGPVVLHLTGKEWQREQTGVVGDLWWVQAVSEDVAYFAGSDCHLLKYQDSKFERLATPGLGKHTIYGVWAAAVDSLYAVGAVAGRNGFIWHYDGEEFTELEVPEELIRADRDLPPLFKVAGYAEGTEEDVWIVGGDGAVLRGNKDDGFESLASGTTDRLFTVHVDGDEVLIVGGASGGLVLAGDRSLEDGGLREQTPEDAPLIQGASTQDGGDDWISGKDGVLYVRSEDSFEEFTRVPDLEIESLHATWIDQKGGIWAVGGEVISGTLDNGVVLHSRTVDPWEPELPDPTLASACPEAAIDPEPEASMARRMNEQLLGAIRRDVPRPTVHARNLLHVSIAMWDAWAAYDSTATGVLLKEKVTPAGNLEDERDIAIAYASYRVLSHRYSTAVGGVVSQACFDAFMEKLELDPEETDITGDSPQALGNRIGKLIIDEYAGDGSNEENNYADPEAFAPDSPVLIVDLPGVAVSDPTKWQQLLLAEAVTQNGINQEAGVIPYVGAHWGHVTPFALQRVEADAPYYSGENPPTVLNDDVVAAAVDVITRTAQLDIEDGAMMDISPGSYGNNALGTNDGVGRALNPATGMPYEPEMVLRGNFARCLAEFWADGPASETPPGHWNSLANMVADHPQTSRQLLGTGPELDPLAWDVLVYLALNGALHDAAIAAWELKRLYTSARPITLIRYLAGLGQRTDADGPSYNPEGIPLVPGLIEVITEESAAAGERHEHLSRYVGEIALLSWRGEPGARKAEVGGIDWIRGADWIPYQRRTFVTPAFPGYVSGHSTFSRAAAEALTLLTGSEFFPGGLASYELEPGYLFFEYGPSAPISLQWATYYDAADQAGQSRLFGGIHIRNDDFDGRRIGATVGADAVTLAQSYFDGTMN